MTTSNAKTTPAADSPEVIALKAQLAEMKAEQAKLLAALATRPKLSFKVSEKGAVSVYGMGRFPVTLYAEQWATLLAPETVKSLNEFIATSKGLSSKADKLAAEQARAEDERKARVAASGLASQPTDVTYRSGDGQTSHKAV
jgi:hypothetical protein